MEANEYKAARKEQGMTQSTMAKLLDVSRETITRRESGKMHITTEAALAITATRELPKPGDWITVEIEGIKKKSEFMCTLIEDGMIKGRTLKGQRAQCAMGLFFAGCVAVDRA